ncbi:MAG: NADH:ubiquinone oxidoreductase [Kiritimatiellae bacterium]|nr:NADH:ubiquinone oxidoreductase [Kiritimatiellia bacterium]
MSTPLPINACFIPPLLVGFPLLGAFLLPLAVKVARPLRTALFLFVTAVTSGLALWLAGMVLANGGAPVSYLFGAAKGAALAVPAADGEMPIRILFHIDAASALMLGVTALTSLAAALVAVCSEVGATGKRFFYPLFLLLVGGVYGMCSTGDLFNFFVFLEITSLSGSALAAYRIDRGLAAEAGLKYACVSSLAGLSFLLGTGILLAQHNLLNMAAIAAHFAGAGLTRLDLVALALLVAPLLLKCGAVPMHHWTPDTYSRAPHPVSAFLLVSSQASLYGLFRVVFTIYGEAEGFPARTLGLALLAVAVLSMFIGVTMALLQHDVKRLIAHHAVSQTGYMILGAATCLFVLPGAAQVADFGRDALAGSFFHMMNYALYNGLLFVGAGAVIYRTGRRNLDAMGGLARAMPWTAVCFGVGALAIAGIPPLSGFASKWVLYESSFRLSPFLALVAMVVSLLTLASFVKVFQSMFLGPEKAGFAGVRDVPMPWGVAMVFLAVLTLLIGLFPGVVMDRVLLPAADALLHPSAYCAIFEPGVP